MERIYPSGARAPGTRGSGVGSAAPSLQPTTFRILSSAQVVPSLSRPCLSWAVPPSLLVQTSASWSPQAPSSSPSAKATWQKDATRDTGKPSSRTRKLPKEHPSPEEMKKRSRRERNRMAAARCRNRRRELTDKLQKEADDLERQKAQLQEDVAELEREKSRLELVLDVHRPVCKVRKSTSKLSAPADVRSCSADENPRGPSSGAGDDPSEKPNRNIRTAPPATEPPRHPSPRASIDVSPLRCGVAYRHGSTSGDQCSDHSLNSPTLLAL
ncbi:fos-related antigen 1-like isoform X2 [Scleropages formosus]|uniref:Fos-related antigen 1-like n=1 Tax=Scleropages formosus TaxID=113540 RepID=A0A8C9RXX7_SCLFO|nr:fos-related antigen 1-like isoform X2 [Scleropages formosus]